MSGEEKTLSPAEARKLWTDALRSGKYQQGKYSLSVGDSYCCLGVACEVYQEHVGGLPIGDNNGNKTYDGHLANLPVRVAQWLDITPSGRLKQRREDGCTGLTIANDSCGYDFNSIADIIDADEAAPYDTIMAI